MVSTKIASRRGDIRLLAECGPNQLAFSITDAQVYGRDEIPPRQQQRKGWAVRRSRHSGNLFAGRFATPAADGYAWSKREIANRRFNCQPRGGPQDLLVRDNWRSQRPDRVDGPMCLVRPRVAGVPRESQMHLICSRGPSFAVVGFRLRDTYYQLARWPSRGISVLSRLAFLGGGEADFPPPNEPPIDSRYHPEERAPPLSHHNRKLNRRRFMHHHRE